MLTNRILCGIFFDILFGIQIAFSPNPDKQGKKLPPNRRISSNILQEKKKDIFLPR
jgi:hypothetical protein